MKIHNIFIKNIASLKGEHRIDFDEFTSTTHLFAITGKTGAGKSSILNAISLALYGEVYKKGSSSIDFVTLGTAEGEINLTFSNLEHKYRAHWKLKIKKKNGDYLKKPQLTRMLFQVTNEGERALEVMPQQILGLSFNEFCKTSILNQGQFAKFLNSKFSERKLILEKFYEGESIDAVSTLLKSKIKTHEQSINDLAKNIEGLERSYSEIDITQDQLNLDKKVIDSLKKNISVFKNIRENISNIEKSFNLNKTNKEKLSTYQSNLEIQDKNANKTRKEFHDAKEEFEQFKEYFNIQKEILAQAIKNEIKLNSITQEKYNLTQELENLELEKRQVTKDLDNNNEIINIHKQDISQILNQNDFQLIKLTDKDFFNQITQDILNLTNNYKNQSRYLEETCKDKSELICKLNKLNYEINSLGPKIKPEISEQTIKDKQSFCHFIESIKNNISNFTKTLQQYEHSKSRDTEKLEKLSNQVEVLKHKLNKDYKNKEREEKSLRDIANKHAILQCQKLSEEKGYCVVCNGPLHLDSEIIDINSNEPNNHQDNLQLINTRIDEYNLSIQSYKTQIEVLKNALVLKSTHISQQCMDINSAISNKNIELDSINPENARDLFLQIQEYSRLNKTQLEIMIQDFEKQRNQQQKLQNLNDRIQEIQSALDRIEKKIANAKDETKLLHDEINSKVENIIHHNFKTINELIDKIHSLQKLFNKYQQLTTQKSQIQERYNFQKQQISLLASKIELKKQRINLLAEEEQCLRASLNKSSPNISPSLRLEELEQKYQSLDDNLSKRHEAHRQCEVQIAELQSRIGLIQEQLKQIQAQITIDGQAITMNATQLDLSLVDQFQEFTKLQLISKSFIEIELNHEQVQSEVISTGLHYFNNLIQSSEITLEDLIKDYTQKKTLYLKKESSKAEVKKYQDEINEITTIKAELDNLNAIIGKDEFRNFILMTIERLLLEQTNSELQTLCNSRYKIVHSNKITNSNEFEVIDYYNDGLVRKVSTLSGGETFLVSLAMAMALAELTRGNTQIDSLFIDEGFGSLDKDSIEEVYDLLINIQTTGRQIGIISHVESLTQRIPINLELIKNSAGSSHIITSYN